MTKILAYLSTILFLCLFLVHGTTLSVALAAKKDGPFEVQVTKFGALNGGTNRIRLGDEQSGLIETTFKPSRAAFVSPEVFRGWVAKFHPRFTELVNRLDANDVVEVKGMWDKADRTLNAMGIPHVTMSSRKFSDFDLSKSKVLVVNCAGTLPRRAFQKVRDFVGSGGALLTTDWALHNLLEKVFPGCVRWNGAHTRAEVVDARVVDLEKGLVSGVVTNAGWKLDVDSQSIGIVDAKKVKILVLSSLLAEQEPDRRGILAVSFRFGRGRIMHLIGHFDNNAFFPIANMLPDPAPVIGISLRQALAANFVINALEDACLPQIDRSDAARQ